MAYAKGDEKPHLPLTSYCFLDTLCPVSDDWAALAAAVSKALAAQFETQAAFLRAAGITNKTYLALTAGRPVAAKTLRRTERALGWPPLTADKILSGDTLLATVEDRDGGTTEVHGPPDEYWALSDEDRAAVDVVIRRMASTED